MMNRAIVPGDRFVPWLDKCKSDWSYKPIKYLCTLNSRVLSEDTPPRTEILYIDIGSVNSDGTWTSTEPMIFIDAPSRARRILIDGDVLISTVRTYLRSITSVDKVDKKLICSTGFAVLSHGANVDANFLAYWVRSSYFIDEIVARSVGVSYPAINAADIGNLPFPIIPIDDQRTIAAFLDKKIELVDNLISKKQRQVELLQEKCAGIISQVVTKGLHPKARMKQSKIEWVGEIPAHWEVKKLSWVFEVKGRIGWRGYTAQDLRDAGDGVLVLGATNITTNGQIDISNPTYISREKFEESPEIKLIGGELLIVKVGASIGKVGIVPKNFFESTINPNLMIARSEKVNTSYFHFLFRANVMQEMIGLEKMAGAQDAINQDFISHLKILVPPTEEQRNIADYLNNETSRIQNLIGRITDSIMKLQEYRDSLISEAVTGKIDVRQEA